MSQHHEEQVFEVVRASLAEALRAPVERIHPETRVFIDLGAESLDVIDIRFRLEHEFGIHVTDREMVQSLGAGLSATEVQERFTVQSIVDFVKQRCAHETV